jgi:hypothetical protein
MHLRKLWNSSKKLWRTNLRNSGMLSGKSGTDLRKSETHLTSSGTHDLRNYELHFRSPGT